MSSLRRGDDDSVHVKRRRPSGPADSGPRERAEAPQRGDSEEGGEERPSGGGLLHRPGGQRPSSSGGGAQGTGGLGPVLSRGGGKGCTGAPLIILLVLIALAACFIFSQKPGEPTPVPIEPTEPAAMPTSLLMLPTKAPTAPPVERPTTARPTIAPPTTAAQPGGAVQPGSASRPDSAARPGRPTSTTPRGGTWTVMLYQDADDKILEQDIYYDLNEAERVGSTDRVHIVTQTDRFRGGFSGGTNWTSSRRFYLTQDRDFNRVRSESVDLGELNTSDPKNLVDFVAWAVKEYPADKYALILSDHGMGWPGALTDPDPPTRIRSSVPIAQAMGNLTYLADLDEALGEIRAQTGIDKLDLIGLDACLMSHIEVYTALAPHARYAVASQEVEPGLGWAYTGFLNQLVKNPDMDGAALGKAIVDSYIDEDQRIVDDEARAEYMRQGSPMGDLFELLMASATMGMDSSEQLTEKTVQNVTLAAVDLGAIPQLVSAVNDLSEALAQTNPSAVAHAKNYAQQFTSIFGPQVPPSYVDLGSLALLVEEFSKDRQVTAAVNKVVSAMQSAVLAEKHGPNKSGANGISIYFPISQLYQSPVAGPESYTAVANRFAQDSLWDDFLAYYFAGETFEPTARTAVVPGAGAAYRSPGGGGVEVGEVQLSGTVAAPGRPVTMRARVTGANAGYAYIFAGYIDRESKSLYVADMDYLESPTSRQIGGITFPDWGDSGSFTLDFEWEPLMFAITDGRTTAQTLLRPRSYGGSPEEAVYTVDGIYTFTDGAKASARLYFSNGILRQVFGFNSMDFTGASHEITPETGDQFTVLEQWMELDAQGEVTKNVREEGKTLTFGSKTFTWKTLDAAPGDYVIGFIVDDLDGNSYESYAGVTVK